MKQGLILTCLFAVFCCTGGTDTGVEALTPVTPPGMRVFVEHGGWCWFQDPRAVISRGKLVVGGVSTHPKGVVKASVYDFDSNAVLGTAILNSDFQPDDHDAPAFYPRPDGSLLAVYARHGSDDRHYYRISDRMDFLHWNTERSFRHPGARVTYMNLYRMNGEDRLYCFYRRTETEDDRCSLFNPYFMTSEDHGDTWSEGHLLIEDGVAGVQRPYVRYYGDGEAVHLFFTEAHPRDYNNSLYYAAFRNGAFYRADGTLIKRFEHDGALKPQEADLVYQGSENSVGWCSSIVLDAKGSPHVAFSTRRSFADHRYHRAYWDGSAWHETEVAYAGMGLYQDELDYTGLITLDPADPCILYISTNVDPSTGLPTITGKHEIYTATASTGDANAPLTWRALTMNSPEPNLRPVCVSGEGHKVLLWLRGPWHTYTNFDCSIVGTVLE